MKERPWILVFIIILISSSCSTIGQKKQEITHFDQIAPSEQKLQTGDQFEDGVNKKEVLATLEELVKQAQMAGDKAVKFLSNDLYIKATDASLRGDSATASMLYKYVYIMNPDDDYLKRRYSVELLRNGELQEAKKLLLEVFENGKYKDEPVGLILAGLYMTLEEKGKAISIYKKVLRNHPNSQDACISLAKAYAISKKYKKADKLLGLCAKKAKNGGVFLYYKGKIAIELGNRKLAEKHFLRALRADPHFDHAALSLGLMYEEKERYKKAMRLYKRFLKKNPTNRMVLSRIIQILFIQENFKDVLYYAEKLSAIDPDDLNLKVRLGILYTDAKRFDDAIGVFKEILQVVPNSDKVLYYLGTLYQQIGDLEESIRYFQRITPSSALFFDANLQIAQILNTLALKSEEVDKEENVERFLSYINQISDKHEELKFELMTILTGFHEANNEYARAIKILSSLKDEKEYGESHDYYLASLYEKNKDPKTARKIIQKMLDKNPENAHALNFLGYSLLEAEEDIELAYEYISKAVELKPNDGYIRDSLGWYYYKTGNLKRALKEIKKAREDVKDDVVINKHLAIIYQELKRYKQAKKYYMEALKNCKIESERAEVIKALEDLEKIRLPASQEDR